jgi:hypothetical protein
MNPPSTQVPPRAVTLVSTRARRLLALAWLSAVATVPAAAQTIIQPGQTFLLGGEQARPALVEGRNVGNVPVELLRRSAQGETPLLTVMPGQLFSTTLPAGHTAMARNMSSTRQARVSFAFNGQIDGLSMRYDKP